MGTFYTGNVDCLFFVNDASAGAAADSYFRNVTIHTGSATRTIDFSRYFRLDAAHGDDVWVMRTDTAGNLKQFIDHFEFLGAAHGESFGRWPNGTGILYPLLNQTLGYANDAGGNGPRVGPILISEISYHPTPANDSDLEYVEISNPTGTAIPSLAHWRLTGGISYEFPASQGLAQGQSLLVLPFDPSDAANAAKLAAFRSYYGIGALVASVGGYSGHLNNAGDTVQLQRPDLPPGGEPDFYPSLLEDEVIFSPTWVASASGQTLQRLGVALWGDDPASWAASAPTPGDFHHTSMVSNVPTDGNWNDPAEWVGSPLSVPDLTSDVTITSPHTLTLGTTTLVNSLTLNNGGRLAIASGGGLTSNADATVGGNGILQVAPGGTFHTAGTLTVETGGTVLGEVHAGAYHFKGGTVAATLADSASLTKDTSGTVYLSGVNSYTGGTAVLGGTLFVETPTALPNGTSLIVGSGCQAFGAQSLVASAAVAAPAASDDASDSACLAAPIVVQEEAESNVVAAVAGFPRRVALAVETRYAAHDAVFQTSTARPSARYRMLSAAVLDWQSTDRRWETRSDSTTAVDYVQTHFERRVS